MERLSSNATLFLRIFFPVFWGVFFGAFTLAVFLADEIYFSFLPIESLRWGMLFFYLTGIGTIALTFMKLKRIELSEDKLYVTNYFKTVRYPTSSIKELEWRRWLGISLGIFHLHAKGIFGQKIIFLIQKKAVNNLHLRFPEWLKS